MAVIGVPTEIKTDENRVAITPAGVHELTLGGHTVLVQSGAGLGSSIGDADYSAQGAIVVTTAEEVLAGAEMIVKVKEPQPSEVPRCSARTTSSTRTCTSRPTPRSRPDCARRARLASPTRASRTSAAPYPCSPR